MPDDERRATDHEQLDPLPDGILSDRRGAVTELRADGRRLLTVLEAAPYVRGSEAYVRKLIRLQRDEEAAAIREHRRPRRVGLPASRPTPRKTVVHEADLFVFLFGPRP